MTGIASSGRYMKSLRQLTKKENKTIKFDVDQLRKNSTLNKIINLSEFSDETLVKNAPEILFFLDELKKNSNLTPELNVANNNFYISYRDNIQYLKARQAEKNKAKLDLYFLPETLKNAQFTDWSQEEIKSNEAILAAYQMLMQNKTNDEKSGLFIGGKFGVGKTHLLGAIANESAKSGQSVILCFWPEVTNYLKTHFDQSYEYLQKFKNVDVLLIDDIGSEAISNFIRDDVFLPLIQYRMNFNKQTFFTSNLTQVQLEGHFSMTQNGEDAIKAQRIVERIKTISRQVPFKGENRRRK